MKNLFSPHNLPIVSQRMPDGKTLPLVWMNRPMPGAYCIKNLPENMQKELTGNLFIDISGNCWQPFEVENYIQFQKPEKLN